MKYLLDTHYVIWVPIDDRRINLQARQVLNDPANEFCFSVSSIWEFAIKRALQRPVSSLIRVRSEGS